MATLKEEGAGEVGLQESRRQSYFVFVRGFPITTGLMAEEGIKPGFVGVKVAETLIAPCEVGLKLHVAVKEFSTPTETFRQPGMNTLFDLNEIFPAALETAVRIFNCLNTKLPAGYVRVSVEFACEKVTVV